MPREHIAVEYGRKWLICRAKVGEIVPTYTVVCETTSGALAGSTLAALTSAPDRQHKVLKSMGTKGKWKIKTRVPVRHKQTRAIRKPAELRRDRPDIVEQARSIEEDIALGPGSEE